MASFMTLDYLKAEAAKGKRSDFDDYLRSAPIAPDAPGAVTHTHLLFFQELFAPVSIALQADLTQKTRQSAYACA